MPQGSRNRRKPIGRNGRSEKTIPPTELDELTGLLNYRGFNNHARRLIDEHAEREFLLVQGDIDRFKAFNDRFGVNSGDKLLATIGKAIASLLPEHAVAGRLQADRFIACLPRNDFDPDDLLMRLDSWLAESTLDFIFFPRIGIYMIDDPSLDVVLMSDRARLALQETKNGSGTKRYAYYHDHLRVSLLKEQELAGEMRSAIDEGQFALHFQPFYRYSTRTLVGAEVLTRWIHPQKGLIGPDEFIPVFERNGLIFQFDHHVWEQACRTLRAWLDARPPDTVPRLSINISRANLIRVDLAARLTELIERYRIPFDLLHLEITESACMGAPELVVETAEQLRAAGFTVAMDDFGSGYSSLNTLKDAPIDILKLDMRFLDGSTMRGEIILASVVHMARLLDLPVIAEGVETALQADRLNNIGCDLMQGFLFSKPLDRTAFERLLDDGVPLDHSLKDTGDAPTSTDGVHTRFSRTEESNARKHEREHFETIMRELPVGIGVYRYSDAGVSPLYANSRMCSLLGLEREEHDALVESSRPILSQSQVLSLVGGGEPSVGLPDNFETEIVSERADGTRLKARIRARTTDDLQGSLVYVTAADLSPDSTQARPSPLNPESSPRRT